jgi:hypothetical protein
MWWAVLVVSVVLIVFGAGLLVRDFRSTRSSGPAPDASLYPEPAIAQPIKAAKPLRSGPLPDPAAAAIPLDADFFFEDRAAFASGGANRFPAMEALWPRLAPEIELAIKSLTTGMLPPALSVDRPGEPTWSLHNRGFGDYRRVRIGGESVAWLRLELTSEMGITVQLRAHDASRVAFNRDQGVTRPLVASRIAPMLAECLTGVAETARAWAPAPAPQLATPPPPRAQFGVVAGREVVRPLDVAGPAPEPRTQPIPAEAHAVAPAESAPVTTDIREAKRGRVTGWPQWLSRPKPLAGDVDTISNAMRVAHQTQTVTGRTAPLNTATALIETAIALVNTVFKENGARLVPATAVLQQEPIGPDSRALSIEADGVPVGLMLIEPSADRIDIAVGVADLSQFGSARRHSHPLLGLTAHPLAETIATCAWPAIAAAKAPAA